MLFLWAIIKDVRKIRLKYCHESNNLVVYGDKQIVSGGDSWVVCVWWVVVVVVGGVGW